MFSDDQLEAFREIACQAARASRDLLCSDGRQDPVSQIGEDIKLREDRKSEELIVSKLQACSPLPILSEESGWVAGEPDGDAPYWVIDPLDGSFNFFRSVPLCCTAVALAVGRKSVIGAIYDFNRDLTYSGGPGLGLFVNDKPFVRPASRSDIIATGYPVARSKAPEKADAMAARLADWPKKRMIGSAALSLAWVAVGKFDSYVEDGIRWWDVAAGAALVQAVGGEVNIDGTSAMDPLSVHAIVA